MPPKPTDDEAWASLTEAVTRLEDGVNDAGRVITQLCTQLQDAREYIAFLEKRLNATVAERSDWHKKFCQEQGEKQRVEAERAELEQRLAHVEEKKKEALEQLMDAQKRLNKSVLGL